MSTDSTPVVKPENSEIKATNKLIAEWVRRETRAAELVGLEQLAVAADAVDSIAHMSSEIARAGKDDVHTYHDSAVTSARCAVCAELAGKLGTLRFAAIKLQLWFRTMRLTVSLCADAAEKTEKQGMVVHVVARLASSMTKLAQLCRPICTQGGEAASKAHLVLLNRSLGAFIADLEHVSKPSLSTDANEN